MPGPAPGGGTPIIGPASALRDTVEGNLPPSATSLFRGQMIPALWEAAVDHGIDPVGMVAQAGKETGWGAYTGNVRAEFYNPAGIKVRHTRMVREIIAAAVDVTVDQVSGDHPLVHQQFPNWQVGAVAHAQHLLAYCGAQVDGLIVDPRFTLIGPPPVTTWAELGGRWAPSETYGFEVEEIMRRLST